MTTQDTMNSQPGEDASCLAESECFVCKETTDQKVCLCCYGHQHCLLEWCQKRGDLSCLICKQPYPVRVEKEGLYWRAFCTLKYLRHISVLLLAVVLLSVFVVQVFLMCDLNDVRMIIVTVYCLMLYVCFTGFLEFTREAWAQAKKTGLRLVVTGPPEEAPKGTVTFSQSTTHRPAACIIQI